MCATAIIANTMFGSRPPILDEILALAFMLEKATMDRVHQAFGMASSQVARECV
jgi:hypothetical protein